ncbi:MAG: ATP-binding cassette domain-containing protein, partial [Oscillospiraceae bacterium]|nr:ATP-binding cassette domain-containing protein [Oscillospiraceae bacterium]
MIDNNSEVLIKVENLHKDFGGLQVLKGIDFQVRKGEVVSIIGPSGGGKSTFLRCLNLLEEPTQGKIWFAGEEITAPGVDVNRHRQKMG